MYTVFYIIAPGASEHIWGVWPPLVRVATWCDLFLKVVFFVHKKNKGKPRGTTKMGPSQARRVPLLLGLGTPSANTNLVRL